VDRKSQPRVKFLKIPGKIEGELKGIANNRISKIYLIKVQTRFEISLTPAGKKSF
jgi:hypothetical protein